MKEDWKSLRTGSIDSLNFGGTWIVLVYYVKWEGYILLNSYLYKIKVFNDGGNSNDRPGGDCEHHAPDYINWSNVYYDSFQ